MSEDDVLKSESELDSRQNPERPLEWNKTAQTSWKHFCKVTPTKEESEAVQDELDCVTTCYICDETYRDPMILPCVHTFCLTCLQHVANHTDKNPGDQMPCPLCREEFTIPEDGFAAVKKNLFMVRLIQITSNKQGSSNICEKHEHENICLYCTDCNELLCLVCLNELHENHRLSGLTSAVDILRSQLQNSVSTAKQCMSDALKKKERLLQKKIAVFEKIEEVESDVIQLRYALRELIDRHADSLLEDLDDLKKMRIKDIEIEEKELDEHLDSLKNFQIYCAELASNGRDNGLFCQMVSELKEQVAELQLLNKSIIERQLRSFDINFEKTEPASLEIYKTKNIIGVLKEKIDYSGKPELVTTIKTINTTATECDSIHGITGMAVLNGEVFIVYKNSPIVSVYDLEMHDCTVQMNLKGLVREVDLRHCISVAGNVYIVNGMTKEILRINHTRDCLKWSTGTDWGRLSVSEESTIVAAYYERKSLVEYSPQGTLLREIKLCSTVVHPLHAIKLGNGHFVVSHGGANDSINRVCLIDDCGNIKKSFGDKRGSSTQQLDFPNCLAVDQNENVLVLDRNNSRVLLLSPELEFKMVLLKNANGSRRPVAMHLDKKTSRLYIADNNRVHVRPSDGKVHVFNIK